VCRSASSWRPRVSRRRRAGTASPRRTTLSSIPATPSASSAGARVHSRRADRRVREPRRMLERSPSDPRWRRHLRLGPGRRRPQADALRVDGCAASRRPGDAREQPRRRGLRGLRRIRQGGALEDRDELLAKGESAIASSPRIATVELSRWSIRSGGRSGARESRRPVPVRYDDGHRLLTGSRELPPATAVALLSATDAAMADGSRRS